MRFALITLLVAVMTAAGLTAGQTPPRDSAPTVPDGSGAWTIQVSTGGGFTGRGRGSVTLTSQGNLACLQTSRPCDNKLVDDRLRPISQLISSFDLSKWGSPTPAENMVCNDCFTTTVTVARREGGLVKITTLSWNDVTQSRAPQDVVRLAEMALAGKW